MIILIKEMLLFPVPPHRKGFVHFSLTYEPVCDTSVQNIMLSLILHCSKSSVMVSLCHKNKADTACWYLKNNPDIIRSFARSNFQRPCNNKLLHDGHKKFRCSLIILFSSFCGKTQFEDIFKIWLLTKPNFAIHLFFTGVVYYRNDARRFLLWLITFLCL